MLSPLATEGVPSHAHNLRPRQALGLGPIQLPAYLDRPQIVTRSTRHALDLAEFDHWAEPLRHSVLSVMTENLSFLLHTDNIVRYPWKRQNSVGYQLTIDVTQFDTNHLGNAVLLARWHVIQTEGRTVVATQKGYYTRVPQGTDYHALVEALSGTLEDLSRDIVAVLLPLLEGRNTPGPESEEKPGPP